MNIKSAKDVMAIAEARGFKVRLNPGPPPMPSLYKPAHVDKSEATEALMEALRAWRLEIIEELSKAGNMQPTPATPVNSGAPEPRTPADWIEGQPSAPKPVPHSLPFEVLHTDGRIEGREAEPQPGDPAMYWRKTGEQGWAIIPRTRRDA